MSSLLISEGILVLSLTVVAILRGVKTAANPSADVSSLSDNKEISFSLYGVS